MQTIDTIISRIEAYCASRGIAESTFGRFVVNDGKFVARLRAGGSMTIKTLERVEVALAAPPADTLEGHDDLSPCVVQAIQGEASDE